MDITCPSCAEPWEIDHLINDAVYDTDLSEDLCAAFNGQLTDTYRRAFESTGFKFAGTHVNTFISCPCCKDRKLCSDAPLRIETRQLLADLMGDDIDGFVAFSEDIDKMQNTRHI